MIERNNFLALCGAMILAAVGSTACAASDLDTVVVRQGKAVVTYADIDAFIAERVPPDERAGYMNSPKRIESTLRTLLVQKQLAAEARALNLEKQEDVKRAIQLATEQVLMSARMNRFEKALKVPDFTASAEEEYLANKEQYVVPGRVNVRHILISKQGRSADELTKLAEQVEKEARAHPDQFQALVEKYSDDPSKTDNHGLIPDATSPRMDGAFAGAAAKLKTPGEISTVHSSYGIHVMQLADRTPDRQKTYDEVKDPILKRLRKDWVDKQVRGHVDEVRNNPMEPNPDALAALRTRYLPAGTEPPPPEADAAAPAATEAKTGN